MATATPIHPEGPRYTVPLVYLPGLWSPPHLWRRAASFFGHRGWEGSILDLLALGGGADARATVVADHIRGLPTPPVLLAHDGAAAVALGVAARLPVHAIVLIAPLLPSVPTTHAYVWSRRLAWAVLARRRRAPPSGELARAVLDEVSPADRAALAPEDARIVSELARGRPFARPSSMPPTLVVSGTNDLLLSPDAARAFAAAIGADHIEVAGGHWLVAGGAWQACVGAVHRWLVQQGGVSLLELYDEAMAEREDDRERS